MTSTGDTGPGIRAWARHWPTVAGIALAAAGAVGALAVPWAPAAALALGAFVLDGATSEATTVVATRHARSP